MFETQVAAISDVHGNRWALEAVLADIKRRGIERAVNLGDSLYGPLDPAGTAEILLGLDLPTVRGNEDRIIVEVSEGFEASPTLRCVRESLAPHHIRWLAALQMTATVHGHLFLCHGSADRDDEYLLETVTENGMILKRVDELAAKVGSSEAAVFLCGHDHVPRTVRLADGRLIVNPGSVGLPAFADEVPFAHAMETGTPHARYSVVSKSRQGWHVENVAVPYDWQSAALTARDNGRPDWSEWLLTGRAGTLPPTATPA